MKTDIRNILPPPSKIVCLAYNYPDLPGDGAGPLVFLKPPSSIVWGDERIAIPSDRQTWAEVELALVIGSTARRVRLEDAMDYVFGVTVANDVTAENIAGRDWHLAASKGLDTFCPIQPMVETSIPQSIDLTARIAGELTQSGNTADRIWGNAETICHLSHMMTLLPGDLILTGTPGGAQNSILTVGDVVIVEATGIGKLVNWVVQA